MNLAARENIFQLDWRGGEKKERAFQSWVVQIRKILETSAKLPTLGDSALTIIVNVMLSVYSKLDLEHIMDQILSFYSHV